MIFIQVILLPGRPSIHIAYFRAMTYNHYCIESGSNDIQIKVDILKQNIAFIK